ncbi:MAG: nitroreductase/quinone reductase family protein, partial [Acidimicrobiia bacterium]|nr:nitroreductase/quinone reductase family protein [Acidimicrobiia bacterium]
MTTDAGGSGTASIAGALRNDRTIDITTRGRRSGELSRIEIWFHNLDGRIFLTGLPGRRDWYANLLADPAFVFHVKESVSADLEAVARPIVDLDAKREILEVITGRLGADRRIDDW